ncbi:DUF4199 domain-containing protein [Mesonia maritima]|uniref:DUF4199 domain-containing protein n=1 Tax=Mesonia maritima TaxID=1793873 RepID=A0ABU1K1Q7_9FLAO|nr:DUF4199 domain-containing protein [Mesonia maritima]MDR6299544.1 hypothetical protein [Mesonia maritima]
MKNKAISLRYGFGISILLIIYFLLLSAVGLHTKPIFSLVNGLITGVGIYYAIKSYRAHKKEKFKYQKGFMTGLTTGFLATLIFTVFFGIYASNIDNDFANDLLNNWEADYSTGLGLLLFVVAVMGFATTLVLTLSFMQLFKDSWNTKAGKKHTFSEEKSS